MKAGNLKKLLEQVPDEADVNIALNELDETGAVDSHQWFDIAGVEEFSWEGPAEERYWHIVAGEFTGG